MEGEKSRAGRKPGPIKNTIQSGIEGNNQGNNLSKIIGNNLKELRIAANLSQETLGNLCGYSASFISRLEKGKINPTIDALSKIAGSFGLSVMNLLKGMPGIVAPNLKEEKPILISMVDHETRAMLIRMVENNLEIPGDKLELLRCMLRQELRKAGIKDQ